MREALQNTAEEMFPGLPVPTPEEFQRLEDLVAALCPVDVLTSWLCQANFNVLKVLFRQNYSMISYQMIVPYLCCPMASPLGPTETQCCGSGMFIPDPDFYPFRIPDLGSRIQKQQQKRGAKKCVSNLSL